MVINIDSSTTSFPMAVAGLSLLREVNTEICEMHKGACAFIDYGLGIAMSPGIEERTIDINFIMQLQFSKSETLTMKYDGSTDSNTSIPPEIVAYARQYMYAGTRVYVVDKRSSNQIIVQYVCAPKTVEFELTMTKYDLCEMHDFEQGAILRVLQRLVSKLDATTPNGAS